MKSAIQARKNQDNTATNPWAELVAYLAAPLEDNVEDVVAWWGVSLLLYITVSRRSEIYPNWISYMAPNTPLFHALLMITSLSRDPPSPPNVLFLVEH